MDKEKKFMHFGVSFESNCQNGLLNQIQRAEELITELKDVIYRISGAQGIITLKEEPPTEADGE